MTRAEKIIEQNKQMIDRFTDLATGTDKVYDSRHRWFYSLIPEDKVLALQPYLTRDDIKSEIHLHIIEQLSSYEKEDEMFNLYLKKSIAWHIKDYLRAIHTQYRNDINILTGTSTIEDELNLDLVWVTNNKYFTGYEKYLLYLYTNKCYTINHIAKLTYQERTTIRKTLNEVKKKFRSYYGKGTTQSN